MTSEKYERVVRLSSGIVSLPARVGVDTGSQLEKRARAANVWPAVCCAVAVTATLCLASPPASAQVVCTTTGIDETCANSGTNIGGITSLTLAGGNATSTNSGTNIGQIFSQTNAGVRLRKDLAGVCA